MPYQYSLILWSVLFGWQVFDEVPDAYTMIGAAIIVAAGLYIFWREQAVRSVPGRRMTATSRRVRRSPASA